MTGKRVVFTGGTGKAGRHVLPHLKSRGYDLLNVDLKPFDYPGISTLIADLTHSGQAFNALTTHFGFDRFEAGRPPAAPDAVVHFAAIPRVLIDTDPMDSYGLSKVVNEKTARAFAMRYGIDIYALRIGNVIEPHEYDMFPGFLANLPSRKRNAWGYIDARDLGEIVHLAIQKDGLGFQVFNAANDTITANIPTREVLGRYCPHVPITRKLGDYEAPLSNRKAREVLGFREAHNWRKYVKAG